MTEPISVKIEAQPVVGEEELSTADGSEGTRDQGNDDGDNTCGRRAEGASIYTGPAKSQVLVGTDEANNWHNHRYWLQLYCSLGWKVFPVHTNIPADQFMDRCSCRNGTLCENAGKHPVEQGYADKASHKYLTIRHKWLDNIHGQLSGSVGLPWSHLFNIGLLTGGPSGVTVLDVDPKNGGLETYEKLVHILGPLPVTATAQSGSRAPGAQHFFFRNTTRVRSDISGALPGIDLLSGGKRLVVLAPSLHHSGNTYQWLRGPRNGLASLPDAWVDHILKQQERVVASASGGATGPSARGWLEAGPRSEELTDAFVAFLENESVPYPENNSACPMCGSTSGFRVSSRSQLLWTCWSDSHNRVPIGRVNRLGKFGGDHLDILVFRRYGASEEVRRNWKHLRVKTLKEEGYL